MKRSNKKKKVTIILFLLLLGISLGYSLLSSNLNISGTTGLSNNTWNIYWSNLSVTNGSVTGTQVTTPAAIKTGNTEVEYSITLSTPGDFYEFTVDAVNEGSIDAMIESFSNKTYESNGTTEKTLPSYLNYSVTYSDGIALAPKQKLAANTTEKIKVRVEFKRDIEANQLPTEADTIVFKFNVTYAQADNTAETRPVPSFSNDSWETIINNIKNNTIPSYYTVGSTKEVDMGSFGTHTLRIANTTTPAECSTEGFSQTACSFVLEFADIITEHNINSTNTNVGGWPASELRTYVNTDIYNALPEVIRNAIVNTTVISGHGSTAGETNFTSSDKLYLLSTHEVWVDDDGNTSSGIDYYDTAYNNTRQLDYYAGLNVTTSNYSGAIKQNSGSNSWWWLRSSISNSPYFLRFVNAIGSWGGSGANTTGGVSPAFRIA